MSQEEYSTPDDRDESEMDISVSFRIPFDKGDQESMGFGADVQTIRKVKRRDSFEISFGQAAGEALRPLLPWLDSTRFADCLIDALFDRDGIYGQQEEVAYMSSGERLLREHIQNKYSHSAFIIERIKSEGK
jgi:hypothetical protein